MNAEVSVRRRYLLGFWIVALVFMATMAFATVPAPLYVLYERADRFGPFVVTLVFAAYALGVVVSLFLAGHVSDRFGRRRVIAPAVALNALSALVFIVWPAVPGLLFARFLSGLGVGMLTATATAHLTELHGSARPGASGREAEVVATAANIGGLGLGPLVSGFLAEYAPAPLYTPYMVFAFVLVAGVLLVVIVPETVGRDETPWDYRPQRIAVPPTERGRFFASALLAFVGFSMFGFFTSLAPQFVAGQLGIHSFVVAGALSFSVFASSAVTQMFSAALRPSVQQVGGLALLAAGLVLVIGAILASSLAFLVTGGIVAGAGVGVAFKFAVGAVVRIAPPETRGEALAGLFLGGYIGMSLPVMFLGLVLQVAPLALSALLFGVVMLGIIVGTAVVAARTGLARAD
ncbi:MFS transporter [Sinomonas terrae]|uniref:MFS transporter n=1 Tax=Sinomonas terrae TaxID=2908838 RepID=A0ABS9U6G8_9MICC|nr:MFS transporter [Sinomonas terrae]MCH6472288.1 MFS transporter [Sinomonas terrae]